MFKMKVLIGLLFLICAVQFLGAQQPDTSNGKVKGRVAWTVGARKKYYAFQGIPYAQPPVGDLRFRPPVPGKKWQGILEATDDEIRCIQEIGLEGSEDCLYLNVYTTNYSSPVLPVMVWIYPGAFFEGDSKQEKFGPDYFLEQDVIIVTFNYRLGVFGFLSTEDPASPGNYGLKDQILALNWVHENIENFGGNPRKVTVFGESAGAASVAYLLQTPLTKGLFQSAIMQSGTTLNPWSLTRNPRKTAIAIGKALDIETKNTTGLVAALRRVAARTLQIISLSTDLLQTVVANPLSGLIFGPSIEPVLDGAVIIKKSHEILKNGDVHNIPCIVGFNSEEAIPFSKVVDFIRPYFFTYDLFSTRMVPVDMNIAGTLQKASIGFSIRKKYFGFVPVGLSDQTLIKFVTDDQFVRSINEYVSILAKFNPVYYYRFSYQGLLGVNGKKRQMKGVGHGEELKYMWESDKVTVYPSFADLTTRRRLVKLWTNFAKTGNPTPEFDPLFQNVVWPQCHFKNITYLDIGEDFNLISNMENYNVQFWKSLYDSNGVPPYDTY